VIPSELESHLLTHTAIADACVIPIPDPRTGEAPKAYVVKTAECRDIDDVSLGEIVKTYVQEHKARHKWLKGVEFVERIPKSGTGKILRRVVRDWERELRRGRGARM
jgi:acyl-coenzyme A synthetase/AMP-(fatty) acid ligase